MTQRTCWPSFPKDEVEDGPVDILTSASKRRGRGWPLGPIDLPDFKKRENRMGYEINGKSKPIASKRSRGRTELRFQRTRLMILTSASKRRGKGWPRGR
jgi:hypothetical protein